MSIVKSLSVGEGDMFYIKHNTDNFTIIDCCMSDEERVNIVKEIKLESSGKAIRRFISTHPDNDHILGLAYLDDEINILNFYCVRNEATKEDLTDDFEKYCVLRDDLKKAFNIYRGCERKWMNLDSDEIDGEMRGNSGIDILWPIVDNRQFIKALKDAKNGESPNNISPIIKYSPNSGARILWMGDLETDFMEEIEDAVIIDAAEIIFAPHHGRYTGKIPSKWLKDIDPKLVIIGEAPSEDLDYYSGYNIITQNSAGDITLDCVSGKTHIYVSNPNYSVDFLDDEDLKDTYGKYIGTLKV